MKIANIDREFLHIFWKTWRCSTKFSGKMCFNIILKVTKNQGSVLSVEDTIFNKPQWEWSIWSLPAINYFIFVFKMISRLTCMSYFFSIIRYIQNIKINWFIIWFNFFQSFLCEGKLISFQTYWSMKGLVFNNLSELLLMFW